MVRAARVGGVKGVGGHAHAWLLTSQATPSWFSVPQQTACVLEAEVAVHMLAGRMWWTPCEQALVDIPLYLVCAHLQLPLHSVCPDHAGY
jgi:hypothetical protein